MRVTRRALLALSLGAAVASLSGCRRASASESDVTAPPAAGVRAAPPTVAPRQTTEGDAGRSVQTLVVDVVTRRYIRYEPPSLDRAAAVPFVVLLHGATSSGAIAERLYGMSELARSQGFVVAYPDALGQPTAWNTLPDVGNRKPSDVNFIRALVEQEKATRPLDPGRIFACGHSSGAIMSYRLAAEASDIFPAVGVVAGTIGYQMANGRSWNFGDPQQPVSVIHFHGTDDQLVAYNGGSKRGENGVISVADSINFWVTHDGCNLTPADETSPDGAAHRQTYSGGRAGTEITLWTIQGGGHEWPGWAPSARRPESAKSDINATDLIWQFFSAHPRTA
jgi:polyhydroxybutyrate depolymerase